MAFSSKEIRRHFGEQASRAAHGVRSKTRGTLGDVDRESRAAELLEEQDAIARARTDQPITTQRKPGGP